ncbi:MAG: SLC13/DASS family transporter, partial [Fimbriimonadaceae bacterium]|nr:SLC13/DASS family transporter [Chitinophagales bacterium]
MNNKLKLILGPLLAFIIGYILYASGQTILLSKAAGVLILMAYWWITEAINIYITSLLPVILFPLLGVLGIESVAPQYMKDVIFLYIGGFVLTFAIERWDLHKRISLKILLNAGTSPTKLLFGFSIATYFISMWLNNTSTTLMMLPVALAIINQLHGGDAEKRSGMATAILLAISFASSIGGTASLVGTLPNMVMKKFYDENFPAETALNFSNWMMVALPMSLVLLVCMFYVLKILFLKNSDHIVPDINYCKDEYRKLGKTTFEERVIMIVFSIAIILWFTLDDKEFGNTTIRGWRSILIDNNIIPNDKFVNESYVAIFMAAILLFFPSKNKKGTAIVTWEEMKRIPIGIIFLFGGGFALSEGVKVSGLNDWIGNSLVSVQYLPLWLMIFILCLITTLFSEFASNTATVILFMTIMTPVIQQAGLPPLLILFPVTIAASYSFMLPAGTPPNTIVFGTER